MKKISLIAAGLLFFSASTFAQKYDDIKTALTLGQVAKAKELLDKNGNEKFYSKPEGYIVKAYVLSSLSLDSAKAAEADKNRAEGYEALEKYRAAEPSEKQLEDLVYKNAPYNLYASYFNSGVADINSKNYDAAYEKFAKVVDLSDLLIKKKINLPGPVDTNALYYAGILAEQTKHPDEAMKYNTRLADLKVSGTNYQSVYEGLVRYYAAKNDQANFEKYRALGKELYPDKEFFTYNMLDFAVGASDKLDDKVASLEKIIAANPNDYKSQLTLGETIFSAIHSQKEGAVKPTNSKELAVKMVDALNKASAISAEELQPLLLLGDHYFFETDEINSEITPLDTKGAKATPAEKAKLADLRKEYNTIYDLSKDAFEKTIPIFQKKGTLDIQTKRQYKQVAGNLAQYYSYKREGAKGADLNKYVALEKKYNDLYDTLRK